MLVASSPPKFIAAWANAQVSPFIRTVPQTTSTPGAASIALGYPAITFTPVGAGGIPPDGADENGILNQITLWLQWFAGGGPIFYDAAYSTAVGGYPEWAILSNASTPGSFWISTVDSNTSDPDTGGANWLAFPSFQTAATAADVQAGLSGANAATRVVTPGALQGSCAFQVLTDAATIAWNPAIGYNAEVTLTTAVGSTRQLGAPSVLADGQYYEIDFIQGAGGSHTVTYAAIYDFGAAAPPILSTAASKRDKLVFQYRSSVTSMQYIGATLGLSS